MTKPWTYMLSGDDEYLYSENDTKRRLMVSDYVIPFGKYKDMHLGEVTDRGYLEWLLTVVVDKQDWFAEKLVRMRLQQLT